MSASNDNKLRQVCYGSSRQGTICLADFPDEAVKHIARYLAAPSQALFAVALGSDIRSSAAARRQLDTLDFGEIEMELAVKLTDNHIQLVLVSCDAANNLKKLKLTNCIHITGAGLEPLRGSSVIEQMDLSLVGNHQRPMLDPEPPISCDHVLPILNSIIETEGCSLKHLQFPHVWRVNRSTDSDFHAFLLRYEDMLNNRDSGHCLNCHRDLPDYDGWIITDDGRDRCLLYGCDNHRCCICTNTYCGLNGCNSGYELCATCQRTYCGECRTMIECDHCDEYFCESCMSRTCSSQNCNRSRCEECDVYFTCNECGVLDPYCQVCSTNEKHGVSYCCYCDMDLCASCRVQKCQRASTNEGCSHCLSIVASLLGEKTNKEEHEGNEQLQGASKQLWDENNQLKGEIKAMKDEYSKLFLVTMLLFYLVTIAMLGIV